MKKLWVLLALGILLSGCGQSVAETLPATTEATAGSIWASFDIYAINDLHGRLVDTDQQPGVEALSTYLKEGENTILLSTGDMWQGTRESNLTRGSLVTQWMNHVGFAAMTLGGHEYDWGEETLRSNAELADFPFLGINVYSRETGQQADYCQSSLTVEVDGIQVGIIGAIGDCYHSVSPEGTENVYFKTGAELTELVKAEATALRNQGADFIIYSLHDGYDQSSQDPLTVTGENLKGYYDTSLSDGYVDLVLEADSHYRYVLQDEHGVYHIQGGANNSGLGHATVLIHRQTGEARVATAELVDNNLYRSCEKDPSVTALLAQYDDQISAGNRVLGNNRYYRSGEDLCRLVAYLYCEKGMALWGKEYDLVLGGGYLATRSPGYLPQGEVTYGQLEALFPFDNAITLCSIRGRDLQEKFLETNHTAYHIKTTPYGEEIRGAIDPDGIYYVVTDSYTASYAPNRMTVIAVWDSETFARDLLAEYIENGWAAP